MQLDKYTFGLLRIQICIDLFVNCPSVMCVNLFVNTFTPLVFTQFGLEILIFLFPQLRWMLELNLPYQHHVSQYTGHLILSSSKNFLNTICHPLLLSNAIQSSENYNENTLNFMCQ